MSKYENVLKITYAADEICPACGKYTADGNVCKACQEAFGIYEQRKFCSENNDSV